MSVTCPEGTTSHGFAGCGPLPARAMPSQQARAAQSGLAIRCGGGCSCTHVCSSSCSETGCSTLFKSAAAITSIAIKAVAGSAPLVAQGSASSASAVAAAAAAHRAWPRPAWAARCEWAGVDHRGDAAQTHAWCRPRACISLSRPPRRARSLVSASCKPPPCRGNAGCRQALQQQLAREAGNQLLEHGAEHRRRLARPHIGGAAWASNDGLGASHGLAVTRQLRLLPADRRRAGHRPRLQAAGTLHGCAFAIALRVVASSRGLQPGSR